MVCFPYPKLFNANDRVDQGAALILCSVEAARAAGVPEDRWVFPLSGADAHDHWFLSHRHDLHSSPAIRLAGAAALRWPASGSTTSPTSISIRASRAPCRSPPTSSVCRSTTPTGR
jgi:acetyl-CoA C-acetyltransferase